MNLIGRYEKVRALGPQGYGPPLMLDRGSKSVEAQVRPYKGEYWDRTRAGLYVPRVGGGIGFSSYPQLAGRLMLPSFYGATGTLTQSTLGLDSNYVAGTSGDAIAARFVLRDTQTFDTLYFFITAYTGTAANVNDLDLEIRADATGGIPDTTGTIDTDTVDPAAATGWISKQFTTPQSLTGGTTYHVIVGDADGNTTDFATLLRTVGTGFSNGLTLPQNPWHSLITTGGWATGNTLSQVWACIAIKFASGSAIGFPFTTAENPANNQLRRGLLISGLTETLKICGVVTSTASTYSGLEIFSGDDLSSAAPFASTTLLINNATSTTSKSGVYFDSDVTLAKSTQYRIVWTYGVNTAAPPKYNIGTGADATLKSLMFGGGSWYWTTDSAGPVWVDDDDAWPNMALLVEDQIAVTSGGGSDEDNWIIGGAG